MNHGDYSTYTTKRCRCTGCRQAAAIQRAKWVKRNPDRAKFHQRHYDWKRRGVIITDNEYEALVIAQNGKCAICDNTSWRRLAVDHDHETGRVRGLLCDRCNTSLEWFEKNEERAANYLSSQIMWRIK